MDIERLSIDTIRTLSCEMIEKANSGHPGIVLGASPLLYTLYAKVLNVSSNNPTHFMRDRFVLSAGHGSAMLYATLKMFGYNFSLNDLKNFRQLNSKTPGHPELDPHLGIEATTGPLGQGVANAVGLALAEKHLASVFNKPDATLINNYTYALVGDGCLMEGVANEALSLAGTLKLNKLIVFYDFNKITIDGKIDLTFKQNTKLVFKGYGFNVIEIKDANNTKAILAATKKAQKSDKPTLIMLNSIIGFGSVLAGTSKAHGAPLGEQALKELKNKFMITTGEFEVLPQVEQHFLDLQKRFFGVDKNFEEAVYNYKTKYPNEYEEFNKYLKNDFKNAKQILEKIEFSKDTSSTRELSGMVLAELTKVYPNIIGGTADLSSSTKTLVANSGKFQAHTPKEKNIMFGVREFGMSAITNGIAMYGGLTPFASTFFVFSDYMRAGVRLSALMNLKVLYVFTHDGIGVGEDGPTHQSIEQLNSFRVMPNVVVYRPCNFTEVKAGYYLALNSNNPTLLIMTRQNILNPSSSFNDATKGGYVLSPEKGKLSAIIIATGSEVEIALSSQAELEKKGIGTRVVSMPSMEVFEKQSEDYKSKVLPKNIKTVVSIEAGSTGLWHKYTGSFGATLGIDTFGKSANYKDLYKDFGLTSQNLTKVVEKTYKQNI